MKQEYNNLTNPHKKTKDEFKIVHNEDLIEDDFEKMLEKDIEDNCTFNIYVDKLEIQEIPDNQLLLMEKKDILEHKNYQNQKLKAYIMSLEKEKEDLIENFKNTTNILLEKIKQYEYNEFGTRPQTAKIVENINNKDQKIYNKLNLTKENNNNYNISNSNKIDVLSFEDNKEYLFERCPNCKKEFPKENFITHSLDCLRNNMTCKICKELIPDKMKKDHIFQWRSNEKIIDSIKNKDEESLKKCINHGANPNQILDSDSGDSIKIYLLCLAIIHYIAKFADFKCLKVILGNEINLDIVNKNKETALFIAIKENKNDLVKSLIELGIDITKKNSEDLTPLMLSCKMGLIQIAEILLLHNANIHEINILGDTPLKLAQRFGNEDLVLLLIQKYKALIRPQSRKL